MPTGVSYTYSQLGYMPSGYDIYWGGTISGPSVKTYLYYPNAYESGIYTVSGNFNIGPLRVSNPGSFDVYFENDWLFNTVQVNWWTQYCWYQ